MEIANVRLVLNKQGDDLPLKDVTPAEAMFLHVLHGASNGGKTFGEEFTKIEVVGTAMVVTDKFKNVIVKEAIPQKVIKGALITPAQPASVTKGKVLEPAVPEQVIPAVPAKGTPGQPDFVAAVAEKRIPGVTAKVESDINHPAIAAVFAADTIIDEVPAVIKQEPILRARTDVEELARLRKKYTGAKDKVGKPIIDIVFPNRLKPELPQKFADIKWQEVDASGIETGAMNYATGGLAKTAL